MNLLTRCRHCKQTVEQIWDANADRWKLNIHQSDGRRDCRFSGATVNPGGEQIPEPRCAHDRLNMDGICFACGADCRGIS